MTLTGTITVGTAVFFILIKGIAFACTGSIAVLSGLFDSIQDLLTSCISLIAIRHSIEPPDKEHRYGHGKAQAVGALIQSFIIFAAGLILLKESVFRLFHPQPVTEIFCGIMIMSITLIGTVLLVFLQRYTIQKTNALSVRADMAHYTGDIFMNIGIICTLLLGDSPYFRWIDGVFGIGVAGYLFLSVYQIARDSCGMLMDQEMPRAFRKDIRRLVLSFPEVRKMADLRTRLSGSCVFIQLCVHLDSDYSLKKAAEITEMIEKEIQKRYPDSQIWIHVAPFYARSDDNTQSGRNY